MITRTLTITKEFFDFDRYTYQVLSTQLERKGLLSLFSSEKYDIVYYIRRIDNAYNILKECFLMRSTITNKYEFLDEYYRGSVFKIVYWNNSQEPANLITRMKIQDSDSYVIFSSDDIPN